MKTKLIVMLTLSLFIFVSCSENTEIDYKYSDYGYYRITSFEDQLNHDENEYYIYYYSEACPSCEYIKDDVLSRISNLESDVMFLFDVRAGIDVHPDEFLRDEDDGKFYTPTLVYVKDGEFVEKWVGINPVLSKLETLS